MNKTLAAVLAAIATIVVGYLGIPTEPIDLETQVFDIVPTETVDESSPVAEYEDMKYLPGCFHPDDQNRPECADPDVHRVKRVVDGDTFVIFHKDQKKDRYIRILGIDTPETKHPKKPVECFGKEASAVATSLLENSWVKLRVDGEDRYDRILATVELEDGRDFGALMLLGGYAQLYTNTHSDFVNMDEYGRYVNKARNAEIGLWNPDNCI